MVSNAAAPLTPNPAEGADGHRARGASTVTGSPFSAAGALLDAYLASRKGLAGGLGQSGDVLRQLATEQASGHTNAQAAKAPSAASQYGSLAARPTASQSAQSDSAMHPVVLLFRQRYRISLCKHIDGQILLSARIVSLPEAGPRRDAMLTHVGQLGLGLATRYGAACVIDAAEQALWLQDRQAPDGKVIDLALRVRGFVNALATWQKTLEGIHF